MKGAISLLTLVTPAESFMTSHYKRTQALVRECGDEPSVVDWSEASIEVLSEATDFCRDDDECDLDELINIKSALFEKTEIFEKTVLNYDPTGLFGTDGGGGDDAGDVSGSTAEDRALHNYLKDLKRQGLHAHKKMREVDTLITDQR